MSDTSNEHRDLLVEQDGTILRLTLNRPERKNALTSAMVASITEAVNDAATADAIRVIVVSSSGTDFCTGIDLAESSRRDRGGRRAEAPPSSGRPKPRTGHLQRGFKHGPHAMVDALTSVQVPVVAGVRGWAAGIGNMLALSADVVVASSTAKFWVPFVTKGFTPDSGNTWLLPRLVGLARAKEMVLRGRPVPGEEAERWGLISACVADDELDRAVDEVVAELDQAATVSVGLAKTLLHENLSVDLAAGLQNEAIYEELAVRSDDFKEGMRAFAEKRSPDFTGW